MIFGRFKEFRSPFATPLEIGRYLSEQLAQVLRELSLGLTELRLTENFKGFKTTVTIAAGAEAKIRNELRTVIPTERLIVRGDSGSIVDGGTEWTKDFVYLKNDGLADATVTVIFLA